MNALTTTATTVAVKMTKRHGAKTRDLIDSTGKDLYLTSLHFAPVQGERTMLPTNWDNRRANTIGAIVGQHTRVWAQTGSVNQSKVAAMLQDINDMVTSSSRLPAASKQSSKDLQYQATIATLKHAKACLLELVVPGKGMAKGHGIYSMNLMSKKHGLNATLSYLNSTMTFTLPAGKAVDILLKSVKADYKTFKAENKAKTV